MRKAQAAKYLGVSERQLSEMMRKNLIPYIKVSHRVCLFRPSEIDRAMSRFQVNANEH